MEANGLVTPEPAPIPAVLAREPRQWPKTPQAAKALALLNRLAPVLECERGSFERAEAIRNLACKGFAIRTIQRHVAEIEAGDYDLSVLGRRRPSDAGERRVQVSRGFDRAYLAAGHDPDQLVQWGARRDQLIMDWWASPAQRAGWKRVQLEVQTSLRRELAAAGVALPKAVVTISQRAVMTAQHFREVDVYAHDRKKWDDGKTRIRRDNSQWRCMEQVVLDVKHLDVVLTRPDGSQVYPKMIAFLDSGTMRMFVQFVFPTKEERGVRQEHVLAAFAAMVLDPAWGLPERIYMDNGSENNRLCEIEPFLDLIRNSNLKTVVKAKPYSGASKPIESRFAQLDRQVFSQMLGYVGGDRMKARQPELGKKARPYPGGYDEFEREVRLRLADLEDMPINSGPFAGSSPRDLFEASGHRARTVDPMALDAHFARYIERRVDRGTISIEGTRYTRPDLPNGRTVTVALSYRRDALPMVKLPDADWAYLEPEQFYMPGMADGALSSARAQIKDRRTVRGKRELVRPVDPAGNVAVRAADRGLASPPQPQLRAFRVFASSEAEQLGAARAKADTHQEEQPQSLSARKFARELEQARAQLEKRHAS